MASPSCELVNDTRNTFAAHSGPVISSAPALGMIRRVLLSRATFDIASATPECTVPTSTSTWSRFDELVCVVGRLGGIRFVVDREVLDLPPAELAALLVDRELEPVGDRGAERRERAGIRQHEADLDLALQRLPHRRQAAGRPPRRLRRQRADSSKLDSWSSSLVACSHFAGARLRA